MISSTQIIFESILTSSTGPPRLVEYLSAVVFRHGQLADAYLVEKGGSEGNGPPRSVMHYVAEASREMLLQFLGAVPGPNQQQHLAGIFIRDPVATPQHQQQQASPSSDVQAPAAGAVLSTPARMIGRRRAAAAAAAAASPHDDEPTAAPMPPSHSFLTHEAVVSLINGSSSNNASSSSSLWSDGVLLLLPLADHHPPSAPSPRGFLFNLCECTYFNGTLAAATYRVALKRLDDAAVPLQMRCDVVLDRQMCVPLGEGGDDALAASAMPAVLAAVSNRKRKAAQQQHGGDAISSAAAISLVPDAVEKRRIGRILSALTTPLSRMARELGTGNNNISCKFFLMFAPDGATPSSSSSATAPTCSTPPPTATATDELKSDAAYGKATVAQKPIVWSRPPAHAAAAASAKAAAAAAGRASSSSSPTKKKHSTNAASSSNGNDAAVVDESGKEGGGSWFFLGSQGMPLALREVVTGLLGEQRPERLALMRQIEAEDAAAAAKRQAALAAQQQQQPHHRAGSAVSSRDDDDDVSWSAAEHRTGSRVTSANEASRASPVVASDRPPRPSSPASTLVMHNSSNSADNSAAATRASSAAAAAALGNQQPPHGNNASPLRSSVVHRGALVAVADHHQQQQQQQQPLPSIIEMWDRRLRSGGPRKTVVTAALHREMMAAARTPQHQKQKRLNDASILSGDSSLVVVAASAQTPPPPHHHSLLLLGNSPSDAAARQLRLSAGTTFGPVPAALKKTRSSKFLGRLSRFMDDEHGRIVQRHLDEEEKRARAARELAAAEAATVDAARKREEQALQRAAREQEALRAAQLARDAAAKKELAERRSAAEARRVLLLRTAESIVHPLEKIERIYQVREFHRALESAFVELFSERLEKAPTFLADGTMLRPGGDGGIMPTTTSRRQVRLASEMSAREAVDFFADVGIMAEYQALRGEDGDGDGESGESAGSDDDDGRNNSGGSSRASSSPPPRHHHRDQIDRDDDVDEHDQPQRASLRRRGSTAATAALQRRSSVLAGSVADQRNRNRSSKSGRSGGDRPSLLQLSIAGCAPPALVTIHVPDNSRLAARLLASTLWKAESIQRIIEKLSRFQLDTWLHMFAHGTASLHRCLDLVLFQAQQEQTNPSSDAVDDDAVVAAAAAASASPVDAGKLATKSSKKAKEKEDAEEAAAAAKAKEEEAAKRKAREEAEAQRRAAEMRANAARLVQIQSFLSEEESRRGRLLQLEQTARGLVLSTEMDHAAFLKAMFPDYVAAAVVQRRKDAAAAAAAAASSSANSAGTASSSFLFGGAGVESPALALLAESARMRREMLEEAARVRREMLAEQQEQRVDAEGVEEKWRREVAMQEVSARIAVEALAGREWEAARQRQQRRESRAQQAAEAARREAQTTEARETARVARHLAARSGAVLPEPAALAAELAELRGLLLAEVVRRAEATARLRLQREWAALLARNVNALSSASASASYGVNRAMFGVHDVLSSASATTAIISDADTRLLREHVLKPKQKNSGDNVGEAASSSTLFGEVCLLRDTLVETTVMSQEAINRAALEAKSAHDLLNDCVLPRQKLAVKLPPQSSSSSQQPRRDAAMEMVVEKFVSMEAQLRAQIHHAATTSLVSSCLGSKGGGTIVDSAISKHETEMRGKIAALIASVGNRGGSSAASSNNNDAKELAMRARLLQEFAFFNREAEARSALFAAAAADVGAAIIVRNHATHG